MKYEIAELLAENLDAEIEEEYFDEVLDKYTFALVFDEFDRENFAEHILGELEEKPSLLDMFIEDDFISPVYHDDFDFEFQEQNYVINIKEDHSGIDIIVY